MNTEMISFSLLSIETILELANQCTKIISAKHPEDPMLAGPLSNLEPPKKKAALAIDSGRKQELIEQVNDADVQRDHAFIGFRKYIEVYQFKEWDRKAVNASSNLLAIIKKYGAQLYKEDFAMQSTLMNSLFKDLDTEQAKADLATLGLEDWLIHLSTLLKGLEFLAKIKPGIYGETNKLINEIAGRIASSYR